MTTTTDTHPGTSRQRTTRSLIGLASIASALAATTSVAVGLATAPAGAVATACPAPVDNGDGTLTVTCSYTGDIQTWTVPVGVTSASFDVQGAQGGRSPGYGGDYEGGLGGRAVATLPVTPGSTLTITAGGAANQESGGYNGGGNGSPQACAICTGSGGGGGASDVRSGGTGLEHRVVIAGGGGGAGWGVGGGSGGGLNGGAGGDGAGSAGPGGAGGNQDGTSGSGQQGVGSAFSADYISAYGGAGGGGYWGGATPAGGGGGGGGGSGFTPDGTGMTNGYRAGNGQVLITYGVPDTTAPTVTCNVTPATFKAANNHKLETITATVSVSDSGSGPNGFSLESVTSNQADAGLGADDLAGDIQGWTLGTADTTGKLRAERYVSNRVYTLTYRGFDVAGNSATCATTVTITKAR